MSLTDEQSLCRFCLDETSTNENPLILPCECRGSVAYVHRYCLHRWRSQDPVRNGRECQLCKTDYTDYVFALERIHYQGFVFSILEFPFPMSLGIHVTAVCITETFYPPLVLNYGTTLAISQIVFHGLYFYVFSRNWIVLHKLRYWQIMRKKYMVVPFLNLYFLILAPSFPFFLLFTDLFMFVYWTIHISVLKQINLEIIETPLL